MRDSNYKSVSLNKAAVSITTNLYDRRALDATCDRPLINSLNHLTFLTSSSAKVRETLATDGGLERLVCILHECHKDISHSAPRDKNGRKTIAEEKTDALIAWKWTLAFQCLVLVGTRGTEKIRERVVQAGVVPVIATVLDNYLLASRNFDSLADKDLDETFVSLVKNNYLREKKAKANNHNNQSQSFTSYEDNAVIANYLGDNSELLHYLSDQSSTNNSGISSPNLFDDSIPAVTELHIQQNLHDINHTITSPRFFIRGVLIPKEDDVVWSLQLLAFISKYSSLKKHLQSSHFIDHLSLRALLEKGSLDNERELRAPGLETDDDAEMELISNLSSDESEQQSAHTQTLLQQSQSQSHHHHHASQRLVASQSSTQPSSQMEPQTQSSDQDVLIQVSNNSSEEISNQQEGKSAELPDLNANLIPQTQLSETNSITSSDSNGCLSKSLLHSLMKFENCCQGQSREEKTFSLIELTIKLTSFYSERCMLSKLAKIKSCREAREKYLSKWNYSTYFQTHSPDSDLAPCPQASKQINVFPLVEKYTVKATNSSDMCYWSGVIMRNSCRKAESGVRQCAFFDCGTWEKFPRQFAKCRRCKRTKYCSKECQLKAWGYHKHWCVDSSASCSQSTQTGTQEREVERDAEVRLNEGI